MGEHSIVGANDTEPSEVLSEVVWSAVEGGTTAIPKSPNGWELLYNNHRARLAAQELYFNTYAVVQSIRRVPIKNLNELKNWLGRSI